MSRGMQWEHRTRMERASLVEPKPIARVHIDYWLIPAKAGRWCHECQEIFRAGQPAAYRHDPPHVLCKVCWEHASIEPGESKAWKIMQGGSSAPKKKKAKRKKKSKGSPPVGDHARTMEQMKRRNAKKFGEAS